MQDISLVSLLAIKLLLQFDQVEVNIYISFLRIFRGRLEDYRLL
jgi:hypothetical protein